MEEPFAFLHEDGETLVNEEIFLSRLGLFQAKYRELALEYNAKRLDAIVLEALRFFSNHTPPDAVTDADLAGSFPLTELIPTRLEHRSSMGEEPETDGMPDPE